MLRASRSGFEIAAPPASSLIESLRGVGYSPETAIADLVDNSISAMHEMFGLRSGGRDADRTSLFWMMAMA